MNLAIAIRRAREKRGWTQEQLAKALGVSVMTIRNWEAGRHAPKNALARVEEVLGIDTDETPQANTPPVTQASDAQLIGELLNRLHDRTARIAELERELALRGGNAVAEVDTERWAARVRTPAGRTSDDTDDTSPTDNSPPTTS